MEEEITRRKNRLDELNTMAAQVYDYVDTASMRITRRRLLVIQILLSVDSNANAVFRLVDGRPRFLDGAQMALRSILDVTLTKDWVLRQRHNERLWRWLRDDRKTLHTQLTNIVDIQSSDPSLADASHSLAEWRQSLSKVERELNRFSRKSGVGATTKEVSLFAKAKTLGKKTQLLYNTVFWLFSSKTHASPTGMQDLVRLQPLTLKRRDTPLDAREEEYALVLLDTALIWYAANVRSAANYLEVPQLEAARLLYERTLRRNYDPN